MPLTGKIMIDSNELLEIVREIRLSLPDDIQQAKWVKDEKERILTEAKTEYEKVLVEARKQADYMVENDEITKRARKMADNIQKNADDYSKVMKMRTYDYVDKLLFDMQGKMDDMNMKYFGEMYTTLEQYFDQVGRLLQDNREELKTLAYKTQSGEDEPLPPAAEEE